jgi:hypothetical protein
MAIDLSKVTKEGKDRLRMLGRVVAVPTKIGRGSRDHIALFRKVANMPDGVGVADAKGKVRVLPPAPQLASRTLARKGGR